MQYRTLGNSGAVVSNYALGTMTFGARPPRKPPSPSWMTTWPRAAT